MDKGEGMKKPKRNSSTIVQTQLREIMLDPSGTTLEERVHIVNQIVQEVASKGRRFFYDEHTHQCGYFYREKRLHFYEPKTRQRISPYQSSIPLYKDGIGGTLWALLNEFRHFIETGEQSDGIYGYRGLMNDYWGYPVEDMETIRNLAKHLGYM